MLKTFGKQRGSGRLWAGSGSSFPWLASGFWSGLSLQAVPRHCHMLWGPEGTCLHLTAHVSLPGTQSFGVRLCPPIPACTAPVGLPWHGAVHGLLFFMFFVCKGACLSPALWGGYKHGACSSESILMLANQAALILVLHPALFQVNYCVFFGSSSS